MKKYLHILKQDISRITENDLYQPIKQTDIDSIDLVVIRVSLEKYFGLEVPDNIWFSFNTLLEALEYFDNNKSLTKRKYQSVDNKDISVKESVEIGMPQMANSAFSESWLLKYLGDKHWYLLSNAFQKKSSEFMDDNQDRLYATFLRVKYNISNLSNFIENDIINFNSTIKAFGNNTFLSRVFGESGEQKILATLMTTFSTRENKDNKKINKCEPKIKSEKIIQLSKIPLFLNDYRLLRKGLTDTIPSDYPDFKIVESSIYHCLYDLNPYYDINGVGLLYYAAYPIISDKCLLTYNPDYVNYHTVFRDIFYFANSNFDDRIIFHLNSM